MRKEIGREAEAEAAAESRIAYHGLKVLTEFAVKSVPKLFLEPYR